MSPRRRTGSTAAPETSTLSVVDPAAARDLRVLGVRAEETLEYTPEERRHVRRRSWELLRQLAVAQPVGEREQEHAPPLRLELLEAATERLCVRIAHEAIERAGRVVRLVGRLVSQDVAPAVPGDVESAVAHQAVQPSFGAAAGGIEAVRLLPDLDEGVVHGVRGEGRLPADA